MEPARIGLRAYDIALGLRNLDERNAALSDFNKTNISGMAAVLAGAIKGRDIIRNAASLKRVAAEVLRISPYAFDNVVLELAELDMVRNVRRSANDIVSFSENIPLIHDDVHERLGSQWLQKNPTEYESILLERVESLSQAPTTTGLLLSQFQTDERSNDVIRAVGAGAELIRSYNLRDGTEISASPLYAFEQPEMLIPLFENHEAEVIRDSFARFRARPGLPLLMNGSDPVSEEMVRLGLVAAPTVTGADGVQRAFVTVPYGLDPIFLTSKKQVLERALALIACIRCGEVSGGYTTIRFPDALLRRLVDPSRDYTLRSHSSTERQYAALIRLGVIEPVVDIENDRLAAKLIPTEDNLEAVELARILLRRQGEGLPERGNERDAANLLYTGEDYLAPIETIGRSRQSGATLTGGEVAELWNRAAGWSE